MSVGMALTLKELFPAGFFQEEDATTADFFLKLGEEFERVLAAALSVSSATPADEAFQQRWQSFGLQAAELMRKHVTETDQGSFCVSNTSEYFRSMRPDLVFAAFAGGLRVHGLKNKRCLRTAGQIRAGDSLTYIERDQASIGQLEMVKHAHMPLIYEENIHVSN